MNDSPRARPARALRSFLLLFAVACSATGCKRDVSPAPSASAAPNARAPAAAPSASARRPEPAPEPPKLAAVPPLLSARCRVLRVKGAVKTESGTALAPMAPVDGDAWLEFAPGSELVVRHSVSARELLLRGPGHILPCRGGLEQVLVESGSLVSAPGTGVRPGAEVWIGTPFGTARYGDAALELSVTKTQWKLAVKSGTVWTSPPATPNGRSTNPVKGALKSAEDGRLQGGEHAARTGKPDADALLTECQRFADESKAGAEKVASGEPGLGERAAEHLRQRKRARAACLSAAAGVRRVADEERRARLEDQIRNADAAWERVPPPLTVSGPRR